MSSNKTYSLRAFTITYTAALAVALTAIVMLSQRADASMGVGCLDAEVNPIYGPGEDDYGQIYGREKDGTTANDLRGVRADLEINLNAECQRIQSIVVYSPTQNGQFEFGYMRGWFGTTPCNGVDHSQFYANPHLFNVRVTDAGGSGCHFWTEYAPNPGDRETFRVSDTNANTYWGSYWKGIELQPSGINMDFNRGYGYINMERGHSNDLGHAEFSNIEEYHDGNGWTFFNNLALEFDSDIDYHLSTPDHHTGNMVQ